jgi:cathepsin E
VGQPETQYNLIVDTGSSNTWVGAGAKYVVTSTSKPTGHSFAITYGSGSVKGDEVVDTVTVSAGLKITSQELGIANQSVGFDGLDGMFGLGPTDLTAGTVDGVASVPTVLDNLFSEGAIPSNEFSLSFEPNVSGPEMNGVITFGGTDSSKFTGALSYVPIVQTSPANNFWGVQASIRFGPSTSILETTAGIVDSGTTLVLIATDAFVAYRAASGGVVDEATGLLRLTPTQFSSLSSLFISIGGTTFELTANACAWPRSLNSAIGGDSNSVYLVVADLGTPSGQGLDFILGLTFLERFYSTYDAQNKRIGKHIFNMLYPFGAVM